MYSAEDRPAITPYSTIVSGKDPITRVDFEQLLSHAHSEFTVTLTTNDGATKTNAKMGYSTASHTITGGGDFGLTSGVLDHHSSSYYNLNSGCVGHYLYSLGPSASGASYDVNTALGSWAVTHACV